MLCHFRIMNPVSFLCICIEKEPIKESSGLYSGFLCQGCNGGSYLNMQCLSLSLSFPSPISSPSFNFRQIFCLADIPTAKSSSKESFKVKRGGEQKGNNYSFTENCKLCCCQRFPNNSHLREFVLLLNITLSN